MDGLGLGGQLRAILLALVVVALAPPTGATTGTEQSAKAPPTFDLQRRIACQKTLEDLAWQDRIWPEANPQPKPTRSAVLPDRDLVAKVEKVLRQEVLLANRFGIHVGKRALQAELDRIAAATRDPGRLVRRFAALNDDPILIGECMVRPLLVERYLRRAFLQHADSQHRDEWPNGDRRADADFDAWWARLAPRVATPERWSSAALSLPPIDARSAKAGPIDADTWRAEANQTPDGRYFHTAIWTGSEMIVWGGAYGQGSEAIDRGGRYDPATDSWSPMNTEGAPGARWGHTAVWTGTEMIIFGGRTSSGNMSAVGLGARYFPASDTWAATGPGTPGPGSGPSERFGHTAVWTGSVMIVWGGTSLGTYTSSGSRYDPVANTWSFTNPPDAPDSRAYHTAVWTGSEMIIWGGEFDSFSGTFYYPGGSRYDPVANTWTPISETDVPEARSRHTAVWTGDKMLVWGGRGSALLDSGGLYDPSLDAWAPTATLDAPSARETHTALWNGSDMLVWGGQGPGNLGDGGRYDPDSDAWSALQSAAAPSPRYGHTAVWAGDEMIVWGGTDGTFYGNFRSGARYDTVADGWTPTFDGSTAGVPSPRMDHTAIWTGNEMIVWGGEASGVVNTGGRYDPAIDAWQATSTLGAPGASATHSAIWTGTEMIVWGGGASVTGSNQGGRYDPMLDEWGPTSLMDAPAARRDHTAVWTGTTMVIWGGSDLMGGLGTGGRYEPVTDSWTETSGVDAPGARGGHAAVWTGDEMIVWGGGTNTGGRYDPVGDSWSATTTTDAPVALIGQTVVWADGVMIVWGGTDGSTADFNSGARYDPILDAWTATDQTMAPLPRNSHTAIWTGTEMIVWGGFSQSALDSGGRYSPGTDSWAPTSLVGAPLRRYGHTTLWTGESMLVWGGCCNMNSVGVYYPDAIIPPELIFQDGFELLR